MRSLCLGIFNSFLAEFQPDSTRSGLTYPRTTTRGIWLLVLAASGFHLAQGQSKVATTTSIAITSGGNAVASVNPGSVVTLTATVTAGSTPVTPGLVRFCDASAKYCEDIHIIGTAQLTSSGTAVIKFRPGIGSHTYTATFAGTNDYAVSASSVDTLTVSGLYPTATTFTSTGGLGNYSVTTTVSGTGLYGPSPSGSVSFVDTSNGNALLAQATLNSGVPTLSLLNPASPGIAKGPSAIAVGDFNGDGIPDLAITSYVIGTITVWLGNGDGTFRTASTVSTGANPSGIAVADFNSDGIPDLAITIFNCGLGCTGSVTVLLGNGDGTFTPTASSPAAGSGPEGIVAGDFNGDGIPDLAVANFDGDSISVLLGNGDGSFTTAPVITFPFNTTPPFIFAADLNGDDILDLATFSEATNEVIVLLGKGDGTFPTTISSPTTPNLEPYTSGGQAVMADLNGDGIPDLVVNSYESESTALLGTGSGTFTVGASLGQSLVSVTVGDFNGDGVLDVVGNVGYEMYYFLGVADGTFTDGPTFDTSTIAKTTEFTFTTLAAADLNGDGLSDVAGPGIVPTTDAGQLVPLISTPITSSSGSTSITLGPGAHIIEANYPGDADYSPSTSTTTTLAGPAVTTLGLTLSSGPHIYGQSLVLTATLSPYSGSGYSTNGEPVSFYNNGSLLGTGDLSNGVATLSVSSLGVGSLSLSANYAGDGRFQSSSSTLIPATISQATPTISWPVPTAITYGTALSATQLNASTPVAGTFSYSPSAGTVLAAGAQTLSVTFTPSDTTDYTTASAQVTFTVNQATPTITWGAPAAITYGTALSATQLDATASVPGTFSYSSPVGTILMAGSHGITATFTPTDTTDYKTVTDTINLVVNQATPTITWPTPPAIIYGTALSPTQLDATSSVPGTFSYSPSTGAILVAGSHSISTTFHPTDSVDYTNATAAATLVVNQATPIVTWPTPPAIAYGTALNGAQLDATASAQGTLTYSPAAGTVLGVGSHRISVTFTPSDAQDYAMATGSITLVVNQATPTLTWQPAAIAYGTALGAAQLNATSPVAGSFSYSPTAGTILTPGTQTLQVTFTPTDTADYTTTTASVTLTVNQATPTLVWPRPSAITYGTALGAAQMDATANVPGNFTYSPSAGTIPKAGSQTLIATFTPTDSTDYKTTTATVTLVVNPVAPTISWPTPATITYGTALGATQLDATSPIAGSFIYSPPAGTVLPAGSNELIATFYPTDATDYLGGIAGVALVTVNRATPGIALSASANSAFVSDSITITASLSAPSGASSSAAPPSGSVAFFDGTTPLGTATINGGTAAFTTSNLAAGSHAITAAYAGDTNYVTVTSTALSEAVESFTFAPSSSSSSTATTTPGGKATYSLIVTPPSGETFPAAINLAVTGLPAGAIATFSPATVPAGAGSTTVTLTVNVPATAAMQLHRKPFDSTPLPTALGLIVLPLTIMRRRRLRTLSKTTWLLLIAAMGIVSSAGLIGCGGGGGGHSTPQSQTYSLTVTATSGELSNSTNLTLTVE